MEVRVLVPHPVDEAGDLRMPAERGGVGVAALELGVGEGRVDGAVADGMDRNRVAAAAALRDRVVPFDPPAKRAAAQEAWRRLVQRRSQWRNMNQPSTTAPTRKQKPTTPQKAQGRPA